MTRQESGMKNYTARSKNFSFEKIREEIADYEKLIEIGCLMAGFAHEINNPLGFVISNLETLTAYLASYREIIRKFAIINKYRNNKQGKDLLVNLSFLEELGDNNNLDFIYNDIDNLLIETKEGLDRIKEIVDSIKDFARFEVKDEFRIIDFNMCVDKALLLSKNELKHVACVEKEYMRPLLLEGNGNKLVQALLNIILNAVHAIKSRQPGEPGLIKIRTYSDNKYAYCKISDNGIGIPKENLKLIFDAFFTTKPLSSGTGLGLSIVRNIISGKHNGEIFVDSSPGIGSAFTVKLPLSRKNIGG